MPTYRAIEHSDHVSYFIDCGQELGDLTALEANLVNYVPEVAYAVDAYFQTTQTIEGDRVAQIATLWLEQQSTTLQRLWYSTHLHLIGPSLQYLRGYYDSLIMTQLLLNPEAPEVYPHLNGTKTTPRLGAWMRRVDELEFSISEWETSNKRFNQTFRQDIPIVTCDGNVYAVEKPRPQSTTLFKKKQALHLDQARRTLKRAFKMSERFGYGQEVRILFNKESVQVDHSDSPFRYRFSLGLSSLNYLNTSAHGALIVKVTDKDNVPLFSNCAYIKDTPSIDQFLAFSNYIKQGLERELLEGGNLYGITEKGYSYIEELNIGGGRYERKSISDSNRRINSAREEQVHSTRPGKRIKQLALQRLLNDLGTSQCLKLSLKTISPRPIKGKLLFNNLDQDQPKTSESLKARLTMKRRIRELTHQRTLR